MEYTYLYEFNQERYRRIAERSLKCREDLTSIVIENGYLLPNRFAPCRCFGHGGVLDADKNYVKRSEVNAYSKYAGTPEKDDEMEIYMGEGYEIKAEEAEYLDADVIYLGYLNNHWGHFLLDSVSRLYPFLKDTEGKYRYAYVVNEGQEYIPGASIARFFELLGISERVVFIHKVTKCRSITIPEQGFMINAYYSQEFLDVFQKVAEKVDCSKYPHYEKVYYARSSFKKAQETEVGESILLELFRKNGFTIISPEKCTLDEQIAIVRNTDLLAGITGTIPHNLLFAKPNQKMLIINKTHNLNLAQMDINIMKQAEVCYVDAYLAKFPVLIGEGPFLLDRSPQLVKYFKQHGMDATMNEQELAQLRKKNSAAYEKRYRLKKIKQTELHYEKDKKRFDYFAPAHLIQYNEAVYYLRYPAKVSEQLCVFMARVERVLKRILGK